MTTNDLAEAERRILNQTREQAIAEIGADRYNQLITVYVDAHRNDPGTIGNPLVIDDLLGMTAPPNLPTHFTPAQQAAALEALGLDHHANEIARVDLEPHQMTVTTHDLDDEGRKHLGPDGDIAKTVTVIPLAL